jgi:arylsulfatase A-like enzyme
VVLVSVDTLRADHLGCYGYPSPTSPFVDSLARKGVVFEKAFAQTSWTLPSHMSILTSRYPHSHQVQTLRDALPESVMTLAEVLQNEGYFTSAFVSWVFVGKQFGFGQGFEQFEELVPPRDRVDEGSRHTIKASDFVDRVLSWAPSDPSQPFFLFLHLMDPHTHYAPPIAHARLFDPELNQTDSGTYDSLKKFIKGLSPESLSINEQELRRVAALYDGEIHYVDSQLKRLFRFLQSRGLLENTLVVFTSDHGEEFNDHGSMEGHGWTLYDEVIRIPLIMRFPENQHGGKRVSSLVQSIDIAPTVLSYVGIDPPAEFEGRNLLPLVRGVEGREGEASSFSLLSRFNQKWAIRTDRYKLVFTRDTKVNFFNVPVTPGFELYDLARDPLEQDNIYEDSSAVVRRLTELAAKGMATRKKLEPEAAAELNPEERARLRALGYADP